MQTEHPGGLVARSNDDDEWVSLSYADHRGLEVTLMVEDIVLESLAHTHSSEPNHRSGRDIRRRINELEQKAAETLKQPGRADTAADYQSDAAMLRWALGEEVDGQ